MVRGTIVDNHVEPAATVLEEASVAPIRIPGRPEGGASRTSQTAIGEHLGPLLIILRWSTVGVGLLLLATTRDVADPGNIAAAVILTLYTAFRTVPSAPAARDRPQRGDRRVHRARVCVSSRWR